MTDLNHADLLVEPGSTVHLADFDPASTGNFKNKHHAREKLRGDIARLAALQDMFFAQEHYALLPHVSEQHRESLAAIGKQLERHADGSHDSAATFAGARSTQPKRNGSS
jgi:hypothetical protein